MSKLPRRSLTASFGEFAAGPQAPYEAPPAGAAASDAAPSEPPAPPSSRVGAGVIGATQRSIADLREERDRLAALVAKGGGADGVELETALIDPSPYADRLPDDDDTAFEALRRAIEAEGQKLPIQVRPHPTMPGRYQIAYGHRRWRAAQALGRPVKALVVPLSDRDLLVAQGLENGNRQDLSFIERALFVARMDAAGVQAKDIRAALSIDDPELARLRQVYRGLPEAVIRMIGRAPKIGRPRWLDLVATVANKPARLDVLRKFLETPEMATLSSDARFTRALAFAKMNLPAARAVRPERLPLKSAEGKVVGRVLFDEEGVHFVAEPAYRDRLAGYLKASLQDLMEHFRTGETP